MDPSSPESRIGNSSNPDADPRKGMDPLSSRWWRRPRVLLSAVAVAVRSRVLFSSFGVSTTGAPDIRNATFSVPGFPDGRCEAGVQKFVNGIADVDPNAEPEALTLRLGTNPVMADVDGVPGAELLTVIACAGYDWSGQCSHSSSRRVAL